MRERLTARLRPPDARPRARGSPDRAATPWRACSASRRAGDLTAPGRLHRGAPSTSTTPGSGRSTSSCSPRWCRATTGSRSRRGDGADPLVVAGVGLRRRRLGGDAPAVSAGGRRHGRPRALGPRRPSTSSADRSPTTLLLIAAMVLLSPASSATSSRAPCPRRSGSSPSPRPRSAADGSTSTCRRPAIPEARAIARALRQQRRPARRTGSQREQRFAEHASHVLRTPLDRPAPRARGAQRCATTCPPTPGEAAARGLPAVEEVDAVAGRAGGAHPARLGDHGRRRDPAARPRDHLAQRWADALDHRDRASHRGGRGRHRPAPTPRARSSTSSTCCSRTSWPRAGRRAPGLRRATADHAAHRPVRDPRASTGRPAARTRTPTIRRTRPSSRRSAAGSRTVTTPTRRSTVLLPRR